MTNRGWGWPKEHKPWPQQHCLLAGVAPKTTLTDAERNKQAADMYFVVQIGENMGLEAQIEMEQGWRFGAEVKRGIERQLQRSSSYPLCHGGDIHSLLVVRICH